MVPATPVVIESVTLKEVSMAALEAAVEEAKKQEAQIVSDAISGEEAFFAKNARGERQTNS